MRDGARGLAELHERRLAMQDVSLENYLVFYYPSKAVSASIKSIGEAKGQVAAKDLVKHLGDRDKIVRIKICDPGQAEKFEVDSNGVEQKVRYRGLVGKSFRPPELSRNTLFNGQGDLPMEYLATKVDSWCFGWSTFYLLTATPLFMSADGNFDPRNR